MRPGSQELTMRFCSSLLLLLILSPAVFAQSPNQTQNKDSDPSWPLPKLDKFDLSTVDKNLDPCDNFYKFVCSKWVAANPIPADEVAWSTSSNLELYNETIERNALQEASIAKNRDALHQKIGDYWASCMNEDAVEKAGLKPIQPTLDRIAALKSKADLAAVVAA